jgi:hypothetical protein
MIYHGFRRIALAHSLLPPLSGAVDSGEAGGPGAVVCEEAGNPQGDLPDNSARTDLLEGAGR